MPRSARLVWLLVAAALLSAGADHRARGAEAGARCSRAGHTVVSTPHARVFTRRRWIRGHRGRERATLFFGCVRRTNRIFALRSFGGRLMDGRTETVRLPRLNGRFFLAVSGSADAQSWGVGVWNLASGRNTYSDTFHWESDLPVDIEVGLHGGVAWIEPWSGTVSKVDRSGAARIGRADAGLERAYDGDPLPAALMVDGDLMTWHEHATARSYALDGPARTPR